MSLEIPLIPADEVLVAHSAEALRRAKKNGTTEWDELTIIRGNRTDFDVITQEAQKPFIAGDYYTPIAPSGDNY